MAEFVNKPGQGGMFRQTSKRTDKSPDWNGKIMIPEGLQPGEYWISGWDKDVKDGLISISLGGPANLQTNFSGKAERNVISEKPIPSQAVVDVELNDDIPF
jgi:hypothetical protein